MVKVRCLLALLIPMLLAVAGVPTAHAQSNALSVDAGLQPNRDYLSLLPFETIDTGSNNVILTFTDLALPANGGRQLRFERVFSNVVVQDPSGPQWRFGIAGVPMKVVERPHPTFDRPIAPAGDLAAERLTTPYFWMLDGSRMETTYIEAPGPLTWQKVQTAGFWRYDREARVLRLPDGTMAQYDQEGRLVAIGDAFSSAGEGAITLQWLPGAIVVDQSLGGGQTRRVTFELDEATGRVERLSYLDRTWTYTYDAAQLTQVVPPAGGPWAYRYSSEPASAGKITGVSTPLGGEVEYVYEDREFAVAGIPDPQVINVLASRRVFDRGQPAGEWTFDYSAASVLAFVRTAVTTPSGVVVTYVYGGFAPQENTLAGNWMLRFRYIKAADGETVETHEWEYTLLQAARTEGPGAVPWGVPRVRRHRVTRAGQSYETEFEYSTDLAQHPFHDFHRPVAITERRPGGSVARVTRIEYQHVCHTAACSGPQVLGLPRTLEVTVAGMTAVNERTYDASTGFRESETRSGIRTIFTRDAFGNVATASRANGNSVAYQHSWGALSEVRTAAVTLLRQINPDGTTASEATAGRTTVFSDYDGLMRPRRVAPPGPVNPIVTTYDDQSGTVTSTRGSSVLATSLDGFGRAVATINASRIRTRTGFDAEGRRIYDSYPFEGSADVGTTRTYDALGRVELETNPDGTARSWSYDDARNIVTLTDENGRPTTYGYRAFGHPDDALLTSVTDADGQTWTYEYDAVGNLSRVVTPTGEARTWQRDSRGLLTSETHPESGTTQYTSYDAAGVLKRKVDARGTEFTYVHDGNERLIRRTAGGRATEITYETGSDNRLSVRNDDAESSVAYDAAGRVTERRDVIGAYAFVSRYQYDANDRVVSIVYPSGRVIGYDRQADPEGRIGRVFESAGSRNYASGLAYHPSGALRAFVSGNLVPTIVERDPGRYWVTSVASGPLQLAYGSYDAVGNVGVIGDIRPGMGQSFAYDALHRMTAATGPYGFAAFAYDAHGNQIGAYGTPNTHEPGTLRLSNRAGVAYSYDGGGNVVAVGGSTFTHTPDNQVASSNVNGLTAAYAYDGDGERVRKSTSTDTTIYLRGLRGEVLTEWRRLGAVSSTRDFVYAGSTLVSTVDREAAADPSACGGQSALAGAPVSLTIAPSQTGATTFEGSACRRVSVRVDVTSGAFGCAWTVAIRKPDGSALTGSTAMRCNAETVFVEPVILPVSGIYTVVVDPAGTTSGSAIVRAWDVVDIGGTILPDGPEVLVPITIPGQVGRYTFDATAGTRVSVRLTSTWVMACGWELKLQRSDGSNLDSAAYCPDIVAFIEPNTLAATGQYTVLVNPKVHYLGTVSISVRTVVDIEGTIDTHGTPTTVALTAPGQVARLRFNGSAGARISLRLDADWAVWCTWKLVLIGPTGAPLGNTSTCTDKVVFVEPAALPSTGTYTVLVNPENHYYGTVMVRAFTVTDITGPIRPDGTPLTVATTTPGQNARLTFDATAGQVKGVTVSATWTIGCSWRLSLLKPDGSLLSKTTLCGGTAATISPKTLPVTGTYTVLIDPQFYYWGTVSAVVK